MTGRRPGAWVATVLATAVSTYALDAFAIAAGALLVASGLIGGLERAPLLGLLAVTYVVWGLGMRANLAANWALVSTTGASTNLLSKAAHDLARARRACERTCRRATSAGYVVTELAKEVPYYASASGVALASDSVTASEAIVFIAGTNIGAAIYEYGLARATRVFLRQRPRPVRRRPAARPSAAPRAAATPRG
jgi:hypothetical protein